MSSGNLKDIFEQEFYSPSERVECRLPEMAIPVMEKKYLRGETPEQFFERVATAIAKPLIGEMSVDSQKAVQNIFYNMMASRDFMPTSPTLMNADRTFNQLAACFVVPVEDSMEGIFRHAIADMAIIQRTGGGTGFDFSGLRPKGAAVSSTAGESSGPISFMQAFNACTDTVKQGGVRRGANMGILRVDHPDIEAFINVKGDLNQMTNFNLSVAITHEFMKAVEQDRDYNLVHNGKVYGTANARKIWSLIAQRAWATGEPGILFIDTINDKNTLPGCGRIAATNPCGEQPLLPYEACNLASINLANCVILNFHGPAKFDFAKLKALTRLAVTFLDLTIDAGSYPLPEIEAIVKDNRKIGLGVMGFADVCYMMELEYGDTEARLLAEQIMMTLSGEAGVASEILAERFGAFKNIDKSVFKTPRRNAAITTIAPTGTISLIAGANYGIEPFFALTYTKTLVDTGEVLHYANPYLQVYMDKYSFPKFMQEAIIEYAQGSGSLKGIYQHLSTIGVGIPHEFRNAATVMEHIFVVAKDITPREHVYMQAAFQKHTDNAVSKTINFEKGVDTTEIQNIFEIAYKAGCKGLTVYRDGCRENQPLKVEKKVEAPKQEIKTMSKALKRPKQLTGTTRQIPTGCGMMLVTVNMDEEGKIFEVLMRAGSTGGCSAYTDAVARLLSIALRYGVPVEALIDQLKSVRCDNFRYQSGKDPELKGKSCPDVVGKFLQDILEEHPAAWPEPKQTLTAEELETIIQQAAKNIYGEEAATCPECGKVLIRTEGCLSCQCGYSRC